MNKLISILVFIKLTIAIQTLSRRTFLVLTLEQFNKYTVRNKLFNRRNYETLVSTKKNTEAPSVRYTNQPSWHNPAVDATANNNILTNTPNGKQFKTAKPSDRNEDSDDLVTYHITYEHNMSQTTSNSGESKQDNTAVDIDIIITEHEMD